MDSCGFLIHQPFQGAGAAAGAATWMECMPEQNDVALINWQKSLPFTVSAPPQPRPLKRPYPDSSLSRSNSLISGVEDYPKSEQLLHHDGIHHAVKLRKGLLSRSSSSSFQALKREDGSLSFISPAQSFSNGEVIHPCSSPFSFGSTMHNVTNEEAVNLGCGSPGTSITTEHKDIRFSPYDFHQSEGCNLYSLKTSTSDEFLSVLSEVPCSHDSISSDVVVSPDDYNSINSLVDSLLHELPQVEGYGENHSSSASQFTSSQIETPVDAVHYVSADDDSETKAFNGPLKYKGGKYDVLAGEVRLLEHQNSSSNRGGSIWSYEESLEDIDKNSQLMVPHLSGPEAQHSGEIAEGQCLMKLPYNEVFPNTNVSLAPEISQPEVSICCHDIDEGSHKQGESEDRIADHSNLIEQVVAQNNMLDYHALGIPFPADPSSDADYNGIRLVHLLVATAEAIASRDMDLASVILTRLKQLATQTGSTMQRVASYFCDGLQSRIEGGRALDRASVTSESSRGTLAAFQILHEISPYIKFGHFTANQAILEAVEGERRVHIVDFEIMEGIQWPSLMQALASKPVRPHLRITALYRSHAKRGLATVQETGKRLSEFATSLNLPFTFNQIRIDHDEEFRPSVLKVVRGEILVVNCMLHLPHMPHRTSSSVSSFLEGIRKLCPAVITLVEDELGCTTSDFTSHFLEALHYYSAMFDSLEASLLSQNTACTLVERVFFAPRIASSITHCGLAHLEKRVNEHSKRKWNTLVSAAGFKPVPLSIYNMCQAKLLLGLFKDGFKIDEDCNRLLLGWRCKPLIAASVWTCN